MNLLSKGTIVAAVLMSCAVGLPAAAQDLKIGYVSSERLLRDSAPAKAARSP